MILCYRRMKIKLLAFFLVLFLGGCSKEPINMVCNCYEYNEGYGFNNVPELFGDEFLFAEQTSNRFDCDQINTTIQTIVIDTENEDVSIGADDYGYWKFEENFITREEDGFSYKFTDVINRVSKNYTRTIYTDLKRKNKLGYEEWSRSQTKYSCKLTEKI